MKTIALAFVLAAIPFGTHQALAQTASPKCESWQVTCKKWCETYRADVLDSCLNTHPNSCKVKFGKLGGYDACLPNQPPASR